MAPRLVVLVLDGFSPRHCRRDVTPTLVAAGKAGAWAPRGGRAVLASATYPNHASLVTGLPPLAHGILANQTFTESGIRAAESVGARGPTLLDAARAAGLTTAVVAGDPRVLGVVGAHRCDTHWPPGGVAPSGVPTVLGHPADDVTVVALLEALDTGTDVVLAQLDNTDAVSHLCGPDSPEAVAAHAEADSLVAKVLHGLERSPRWRETIVAIVSDHGQRGTDPDAPPIDLPGALAAAGLEAEVIEEGSAALVRTTAAGEVRRVLGRLGGVAGVRMLAPSILYAHAVPGRGFSSAGCLLPGVHGCPETAATLCIATGGHPAVASFRQRFQRAAPTSADWPRLLARAAGLAWPPAPGGPATCAAR